MSLILKTWLWLCCFKNTFWMVNLKAKRWNLEWGIRIWWLLKILSLLLTHFGKSWCLMCCHYEDISMMFAVQHLVIWLFVSRRMTNLPILILNHMFGCMNKGLAGLPFVQMITSTMLKKFKDFNHYCREVTIRIISLVPIQSRLSIWILKRTQLEPNSLNNIEENEGAIWDTEIVETLAAMDALEDSDE